jgi:hypothetical protein
MTNPKVDPDEALTLYAVAGPPYLALQLERLGISDPEESLEDARFLRRDLLETVDRRRTEQRPGWWRRMFGGNLEVVPNRYKLSCHP